MQSDKERFGISSEEADLVNSLVDDFFANEVLGLGPYLERCLTKAGETCLRANVASSSLAAFLLSDESEDPEDLEKEFLALEDYIDVFRTTACQDMVHETLVMDSFAHAVAGHAEESKMVDKDFANVRLAKMISQGELGNIVLSPTIQSFLESRE